MNSDFEASYNRIRSGGAGFYEQKRGLIAVYGGEAVQFLNGLITNDVGKLDDSGQMLCAFPNAQGRLIAVARVTKHQEKFLFETEEATHGNVYNNLFRFTFAGDFFVEDLSAGYHFFTVFGSLPLPLTGSFLKFDSPAGRDHFVGHDDAKNFLADLRNADGYRITDELYETLRVESGIPRYGVDMDETTIVPELGLEGLISYNKGCYVGQEIIARIHFRGHVAKQLTGLVLASAGDAPIGATELLSPDGKNAGRITSSVFSPMLETTVALAYVRYDYLAEGTELKTGNHTATVKKLPFVSNFSKKISSQ